MKFFSFFIGMVLIIEGVPYFAFTDKMRIWVEKIMDLPDPYLRWFGLFLMLLGLGIVN